MISVDLLDIMFSSSKENYEQKKTTNTVWYNIKIRK